ncbi:hypothetical protein KDW_32590 [Dictyobacter vulcani]|uniref:DUF4386 domain-containing protein n=1 Tax=Dictyobacter vulcani TaxID=2607529 RepID=A0A5J4KRT1_9CHLR|nr:hypothetical protein [Dictyobacter vulcani]GER89097.1 hypothetical protein KDW_32590 [Dictyobacter vulcani]
MSWHFSSLNRVTSATTAAYLASVLFAIHLVTYLIPVLRDATGLTAPLIAEPLTILAVAEHLCIFLIIPALPAPDWARIAGYGWLVVDIASDIMQLNGTPRENYLPLRYGGHISAALWILLVSLNTTGALRIIGILLALDLAIYSFIAFIPLSFLLLLPSLILLPLWLALSGRFLARKKTGDAIAKKHQ